jgi:hypothetical protein
LIARTEQCSATRNQTLSKNEGRPRKRGLSAPERGCAEMVICGEETAGEQRRFERLDANADSVGSGTSLLEVFDHFFESLLIVSGKFFVKDGHAYTGV